MKNTKEVWPKAIFDSLVKHVTFVACECAVIDSHGALLLTWRDDQFWKGWHIPGGLLRYKESFLTRIRATLKRETGLTVIRAKLLDVYNYQNDPRGHSISMLFLCTCRGSAKKGTWFKKVPPRMISAGHKAMSIRALHALKSINK